jgi:MFS family permease
MGQVESSDEASWRYPGWRAVATCFVMALFGWGFAFYGHSVYLAELQRQHGWTAALVGGASSAFYIGGALLVAFVGDAIARFGPRRVVLVGIAGMAASTLMLPHITAPWQLYAVYLPMTVGWAALGLGSITNVLGLWFRAKRGLAISLALNGASCGGIVLVPVLVFLTERWGFARAMLAATAAMVVLLVPLATLLGDPRPSAAAAVPAGQGSATLARIKTQALRGAHFWTVAGPFALALTAQVGFIVHMIAFLSPIMGRGGAGTAVAVTTVMAVIGRVGLGTIIDRLDQRRASACAFASQAAALLVMTQTREPAILIGACAVFGFSVGNLITFPALIIQREFDARAFGALTALATAVAQFTYSFGPGLLGLVRDATGGYAAALALCVAFDLAGSAVVLLRPRNIASGAAAD